MNYKLTLGGVVLPVERVMFAREVGHRLAYWVYADADVVNEVVEHILQTNIRAAITPIPVLPDGTVVVPMQEGYAYVTGGVIELN